MLPISLLNAAQGQTISIECKSGRSYTGRMQACDLFMNLTLENVKEHSSSGGDVKEYPELYLRGYSIKFVKVPDQILEDIVEERQAKRQEMRTGTPASNRKEPRRK